MSECNELNMSAGYALAEKWERVSKNFRSHAKKSPEGNITLDYTSNIQKAITYENCARELRTLLSHNVERDNGAKRS